VTSSGANFGAVPNGDILEDEDEFDEVVERFESSYNFRFEEPDAAQIPSFPRAVESVRRTTEHAERRHAARERRRERKEAEKVQRREEVKRLKGLKTREMETKLERIGKEGGWTRSQGVSHLRLPSLLLDIFADYRGILVYAALEALDLDGDWDAEAHDRQMAAVLAETDGVGASDDDGKPTWDDDIDVDDIIPKEAPHKSASKERKKMKKKEKEKKKRVAEDEANAVDVDDMDADVPRAGGSGWDEVEWDGTEEMRKRVLDRYLEEINELEFNDMVRPLLSYPDAIVPHALDVHVTRLQGHPLASATFESQRPRMR
jgi:protein KRI1